MDDGSVTGTGGAGRGLSPLRRYGLAAGRTEPDFDALATLAARLCRQPRAVVSMLADGTAHHIGRSYDAPVTPVVIAHPDPVISVLVAREPDAKTIVVADMAADPDLAGKRAVRELGLRFFAAAPLRDPAGATIGAIEVGGPAPATLEAEERDNLAILGRQVIANLELRRVAASEARAIDALERQNARLRDALEAERILKMEIDHRVKNSLQVVSSLLKMQAAPAPRETRDALLAARGRVEAIASIHAALHRVSAMDRVYLPTFGTSLIEELAKAAPESVALLPRMGEVELSTSQASALAILMNEFVANSLKHGFPDGRAGSVALDIARHGDRVRAVFADDGVGRGPGAPARPGLGSRIMEVVAGQLGARLDFSASPGGMRLTFDFPLDGRA